MKKTSSQYRWKVKRQPKTTRLRTQLPTGENSSEGGEEVTADETPVIKKTNQATKNCFHNFNSIYVVTIILNQNK